ncbi:MAG TPA: hypothetical protein VK708_23230 [Bryobacteraceae bacterium]|jgi:hypothetical protein|nr:hypothetical protein [Bryobacteraceae bacterium]
MRKRFPFIILTLLAAAVLVHPSAYAASLTVLTVPWIATSPLTPHSAYITMGGTEIPVTLQATVPSAVGSSDTFSVTWVFGDGSPNVTFPITSPHSAYDISTVHTYPAAAVGTAWTATVTVTDTTNSATGSAHYYVTQQKNTLAARVNVAIDLGLWYMHQTMWRSSTTVGSNTVQWGGWDNSCTPVNGESWDCLGYGSINAANVQAFEVSGHLGNGPTADPYTDDVSRGLARMFFFLADEANVSQTYQYNPAVVNYSCSNGMPVTGQTPGTYPYCGPGTQIFYNAGATSCTSPPCNYTFDSNTNGQMIYSNDNSGEYIYTTGPFIDALVASANPTAKAPTGSGPSGALPGILGQTYKSIVQDMADWYGACQYEWDYDLGNPASGFSSYYRGYGGSDSGGGWLYDCQEGDDNSTSQWAAIGLIGADRGFGVTTPKVVKDFNNVWVTNSQDVQQPVPTGTDPYAAGDDYGAFGYRGSLYYSNPWSSFATTPSGMVQMALDGIGRTKNTAFGDATTDPDQRFNAVETYYADNFCNAISGGATNAPRAYSYGLFSFTKSMLLHNPNGVLSPIQFLRTSTPNVFPGNPGTGVPKNELDWYGAVSTANGGTDPCDGVAQTLVNLQLTPADGVYDGHWWGNNYDSYQFYYETAWSIIMLNKTVFVSCVNNLAGRGNASGPGGAQVTLSWTAQTNATGYSILRSSASGGPYTQVGTTGLTGYRDGNDGLLPNTTYYYVVQPLQGSTEICQSNQAAVAIP